MEMQLHFFRCNPPNSFHKTPWFVVLLPEPNGGFKAGARRNAERGLLNDLIAGVELRNDKMARRAVDQHSGLIGIVIRPNPRKAGQQTVVQIDDPPPRVLPTACGWQHLHVTSKHHVIHLVLIEYLNHSIVVSLASIITNLMPRNPKLFGHSAAGGTISNHDGTIGRDLAISNRPEQCQSRFGPVGGADREPGSLALVRGPDSD